MGISIGGNTLLNTTSGLLQNSSKTDALENSLSGAGEKSDDELLKVCKSFESYFVEQVYKEMKKTVHSSDDEGEYMQYFGDMLVEQYAEQTTDGDGVGVAQMLYESMKRK